MLGRICLAEYGFMSGFSITLISMPYPEDLSAVFAALAEKPWSQFLDSSTRITTQGRYSILVTAPRRRLWQQHGQLWVVDGDSAPRLSASTLQILLQESMTELFLDQTPCGEDLPFTGGALGYLAYDFALPRQGLGLPRVSDWPEAAFGIYDTAFIVDHQQQRAWLSAPEARMADAQTEWEELLASAQNVARALDSDPMFQVTGPVRAHWTPEQYRAAFYRVQEYIQAGDCYQVNLAQPFSARYQGSPWALYAHLRQVNPAAFSAFLNFPWGAALSFSPERLLQLRQGRMQVRPIKGTCPRSENPVEDRQLAEALIHSPKDRAENVMIVDLLRNDLGKVAETGSVSVRQLCGLESNVQVHHLVSVVEARLKREVGTDLEAALAALEACFPGGSITGAPKRRAVEIIAELEAEARGLYCGSIGYIDRCGGLDMNIAIRSLSATQGILQFWAGGGIVADSDPAAEYQETLDKVAIFHRELAVLAGLA